jgi:hypothetical protein
MAPAVARIVKPGDGSGSGSGSAAGGAGARDGLWSQILRENARSATASDRAPERHVVVLGSRGSGKRTLVARLQRRDRTDMPRGMALEYTHVECTGALPAAPPAEPVRQTARLSVWDLNSPRPEEHVDLLQVPLAPRRAPGAAFVIVVDMSRPWDIATQLEGWLGAVKQAAGAARKALDAAANSAEKNSNGDDANKSSGSNSSSSSGDGGSSSTAAREPRTADELLEANMERFRAHAAALRDGERLPLDAGTLSENCGFPIIVAAAKCDAADHLEREYDFKEHHHEFVQHYLRRTCLTHGASLVYTSAKGDVNVPVLFAHLNRLLYGWTEPHDAQVIERSSVFVPLGWDSGARLEVLADTLRSSGVDAGAAFEDVIPVPKSVQRAHQARDTAQTSRVSVEDEQAFLRAQLESGAAQSGGGSRSGGGGGGGGGSSSSSSGSTIGGGGGASGAAAGGGRTAAGTPGAAAAGDGKSASASGDKARAAAGGSGGGDSGTSLNAASEFFATLLPGGKGGKSTPNRSALRKDVKKEIANLLDGAGSK